MKGYFIVLIAISAYVAVALPEDCQDLLDDVGFSKACHKDGFADICPGFASTCETYKERITKWKKYLKTREKKKYKKKSKKKKADADDDYDDEDVSEEKSEKKKKRKKSRKKKGGPKPTGDPVKDEIAQCCYENGVQESCWDMCSIDPIDLRTNLCENHECGDAIKKAAYCANQGKNNWDCCITKGIGTPTCMPFCDGSKRLGKLNTIWSSLGAFLTYNPCVVGTNQIRQCQKERHSGKKEWTVHKDWGPKEDIPPHLLAAGKPLCLKPGEVVLPTSLAGIPPSLLTGKK